MISIKLESGESVNLDPVTVDAVKKRPRKGESLICIGAIELVVLEAPSSLVKRILADGGDPVWHSEKRADSFFEPAADAPISEGAAPEGETLPVGGEDEGGLST